MSRNQRLAFLALAAIIAVAAVVLLSSGEEEPRPADRVRGTTNEDLRGGTAPSAPQEQEPIVTQTTEAQARPAAPLLTPGSGLTVKATKGERVRFAVRSDEDEEVHVHGYDIVKEAPAGRRVELAFEATIEGIFEIELERSHRPLGRLRVEP